MVNLGLHKLTDLNCFILCYFITCDYAIWRLICLVYKYLKLTKVISLLMMLDYTLDLVKSVVIQIHFNFLIKLTHIYGLLII